MRWGAHQADARIAAKNAIKIQAALIQSIDAERIVQAYLHTHPTSNDPAQDKTRARAWAMMNIVPDTKPLKAVLRRHWAELYVTGVAAAGEAIYRARMARKGPDVGVINWDTWQPGDLATAALLRPPQALQDLLETAGIKISGINDTGYQNIGTALADGIARGDTITQMASAIQDVIASPQRALTIAVTEGSRAMTIGALANYQESGITQTEWSTSDPINCVCVDLDGEVRDIGEEFDTDIYQPPAHPNCRCVLFPVIPDYATGDGTDGGTGTDTGSFGGSDVASAIAFEDSGDWSDAESDTVFAPDKPKKKMLEKYSDEQPRDERGRFASSGTGKLEPIETQPVQPFALKAKYPDNFLSTLTTNEIEAVRTYQGNGYLTINGLLRNGDQSKWVDEANKPLAEERIKNMDAAIQKAPSLPENSSVFRAIDAGVIYDLEEKGGVGQIFTDKGFTSTTILDMREMSSEAYKPYENRGQVIVEIQMTDKTSGLLVDKVHDEQSLMNLNMDLRLEREVILPRGTSFSYQGYDETKQVYVLRRLT